ncbi:hypothetical protein GQ457_15G001980 [Hibiscus cannabinus]
MNHAFYIVQRLKFKSRYLNRCSSGLHHSDRPTLALQHLHQLRFARSLPGSPCCEAITNLNLMTHSTDNQRSLCGCLMGLITANNSNSTAIATLPGFCGVLLGFTIEPGADCDSYIYFNLL